MANAELFHAYQKAVPNTASIAMSIPGGAFPYYAAIADAIPNSPLEHTDPLTHNGNIYTAEQSANIVMTDPIVETPLPSEDLSMPIASREEEQNDIPSEWKKWPTKKRPPLIRMPDGRLGISILMTDGDGSFFPEDFTEEFVTKHPQHTKYEQRIRTSDSLQPGKEVFTTLLNTEINEGVPIMNFITGRSCPEMRAIAQAMGDAHNDSFVIGGDGSDFSPPKWMWKFIDEKKEQIEYAGFRKVNLADGSSVLSYSEKSLDDINAMLVAFNLNRAAADKANRRQRRAPIVLPEPENLTDIARTINQKIQHGDEKISWLSLLRGSSTYLALDADNDQKELIDFATQQGFRTTRSPHEAVLEIHGVHTGKETAFEGFTKLMEILLENPESKTHTGLSITFGGNGKNDIAAAEWLIAQRETGRLHANVYFFPTVNDPTKYFVDTIPQGAKPVNQPHAFGWRDSILPEHLRNIQAA